MDGFSGSQTPHKLSITDSTMSARRCARLYRRVSVRIQLGKQRSREGFSPITTDTFNALCKSLVSKIEHVSTTAKIIVDGLKSYYLVRNRESSLAADSKHDLYSEDLCGNSIVSTVISLVGKVQHQSKTNCHLVPTCGQVGPLFTYAHILVVNRFSQTQFRLLLHIKSRSLQM